MLRRLLRWPFYIPLQAEIGISLSAGIPRGYDADSTGIAERADPRRANTPLRHALHDAREGAHQRKKGCCVGKGRFLSEPVTIDKIIDVLVEIKK